MILLYKGKSAFSKLIRWRTWGDYSHAAWWMRDGSVVEAWQPHGVSHVEGPATLHTPGTEIDVFDFDSRTAGVSPARADIAEQFLLRQVGKKYDFRAVFSGFTFRLRSERPDKWFCSELVRAAACSAHQPLFSRIPNYKISPSLLSYSRELIHIGTLTTIDQHDFSFQTLEENVPSFGQSPLGRGAEGGVGYSCPASDLCPLPSGGLACH